MGAWLRALALMALATAAAYGLAVRHGSLPPLGAFLSPFTGLWQSGRGDDGVLGDRALAGLDGDVRVVWDDRRVPHIFAESDRDLVFAQGYLEARDRLWQMDTLARVAAGRLSEVLGPDLIEHDRFRRRVGMGFAAEHTVEAMRADPARFALIEAYCAGVNAWIAELDPASLPLEYKLLDYTPERWTPLHVAYIIKYIAWSLTGRSADLGLTRARERLGAEALDRLFPRVPPYAAPVIPAGTAWDFEPVALPSPPEGSDEHAAPGAPARPNSPAVGGSPSPDNGSNNWAVAPARTRGGAAILANDPHLPLSLPAIWYELQLSGPGFDVYGVSLPGTPLVTIGFNRHIAWGVTNAASDVLDFYTVEFRDAQSRDAYRHGDTWRPTETRRETIRVRGRDDLVETVVYTHHGPVAYSAGETPFQADIPVGTAVRWVGHDPSDESAAYLTLARARGYDDFVAALNHLDSPGLNVAYADVAGTVAMWHVGRYPLRWPGQGRYVADGSDPAQDWQGFVPRPHVPHIARPARGYVSSANQLPADADYPYYLGHAYATFTRGARINERLEAMPEATPQDLMALQNDDFDMVSEKALPALLGALDRGALDETEARAYEALAGWDQRFRADSVAPTVFRAWLDALVEAIWADELPPEGAGRPVWPRIDVTLSEILREPPSPYLDDRGTNEVETLEALARSSFRAAVAELVAEHGPFGDGWQLGRARGTDIRHLLRLPGLGRDDLYTGGGAGIVQATSQHHGPSWRMVVEMSDPVRAWGIYPGGQSGSPGSGHYDDFIEPWLRGELVELLFLESADRAHVRVAGTTRLEAAR